MAPSPSPQRRELSRPVTVAIASVGSVVAAIVVSKVWGPGTLIGAAATPVIITLVVEGLRRPVETVVVRTPAGTQVHEVGAPRPRTPDASAEPTTVAGPEIPPGPRPRRGLQVALATGLIAFVIGAFALTSTELIFGDSAGSGDSATTLFSGRTSSGSTTTRRTSPTTETTTPTVTETTTTTAPAETAPTTTEETTPEATPPAAPEGGATGATGATGTTTP